MSRIAELRAEISAESDSLREIDGAAKKEKREFTPEENQKAREHVDKIHALKEQLTEHEEKQALRDSMSSVFAEAGSKEVGAEEETPAAKSFGDAFVSSENYKRLMKTGLQGEGWSTGPVLVKTLLSEGSGSGGPLILPDVQAGILDLKFKRLTVADLLASGQTTSNTIEYLKETTATNAAVVISEGGTKQESTLVFAAVTDPVRKIATLLPVTDEMLADYAQIRSYINGRLALFVRLTEEDQLLNGDGTGVNLTGIMNRTGVQTQAMGGDTAVDAIYKAVTLVRVNAFMEPDGLVVHPNDWQQIRLSKDGNNQYYGGGPFTGAYGNGGIASDSLWGLRVVITPSIAEGTGLVGAFSTSAQVFRRQGITIDASNSHSTFFAENKTMLRAEERLGLAVYRPAAFAKVTGI